jgi:hypothetical protein
MVVLRFQTYAHELIINNCFGKILVEMGLIQFALKVLSSCVLED